MKKIVEGLQAYDHPGVCPKCGNPMRSLELYHADTSFSRGETVVDKTYYITRYMNIMPRTIGFCDTCCQREIEANAMVKPRTGGWIKGLVITLIAIGGILAVSWSELEESTTNVLLGIALLLLIYGLYGFVTDLRKFRKQRQEYVQYKSGTNEPYSPWSAATIADALTKALNGEAYLTPEYVSKMAGK